MHAWTVPGVVNSPNLGTIFACTNALTAAVIVGIEAFGSAGNALNDASSSSLVVAPGATVLFGGQFSSGFSIDSTLGVGIFRGSARVLTTTSSRASDRVLCSAFVADSLNDPPVSLMSLPVVKKTTQQGD